ncbi:hypothetical protein [Lentzea indica]|uniref:hypothetical protein n=1 Tax=Lentzea indica TaxID=2604800 RepID=UPI00143B5ED7|nr:hypothetical protein [Lentzea indica]
MSDEPQTAPDESQINSEVGPFQPYVSKATGPGTGPDWSGSYPAESLRRIRASSTAEEAGVQATTEVVILLHSIRRILMLMLVIIPIIAAALVITLIVVSETTGPAPCTSIYSCR